MSNNVRDNLAEALDYLEDMDAITRGRDFPIRADIARWGAERALEALQAADKRKLLHKTS